ncbi:DUF1236 domain-containing protein [Vannielia litorea]|uniref:SH3 domain-containing protein n=1 Tax=Vannielia litorea TaxID=1217970 RepID=A0A1N6FGH9_9RHOB|nr:DUF1236 domain-containing protein [Vannielia litorea]SIN94369.1 SH3 domain-containing protein [Vannielia litorea]
MKPQLFATAVALVLVAGPSLAVPATATTDLNLRAGPGPEYPVVGTIQARTQAEVEGCLEAANWCKVTYMGQEGWAFGDYLSASAETATPIELPKTVTYTRTVTKTKGDESTTTVTTATTQDPVMGALLSGPSATRNGALLAAQAAANDPGTQVVTYVTENPVAPVYLDGEVVLGAGVPETVTIYQVPDSDYSYVNINGQNVLVERQSRSIVYVYR